jgi:hypothetical protein
MILQISLLERKMSNNLLPILLFHTKKRHPSLGSVDTFLFVIPEVFYWESRRLSKIPDKKTSGMTGNCQLIYEGYQKV